MTSPKIDDRVARLNAAGAVPMTAEEILAGETQGGIPRPAFLTDRDNDGDVDLADPPRSA